jgi:hypothetical protein
LIPRFWGHPPYILNILTAGLLDLACFKGPQQTSLWNKQQGPSSPLLPTAPKGQSLTPLHEGS